jgi:hypothetical protein
MTEMEGLAFALWDSAEMSDSLLPDGDGVALVLGSEMLEDDVGVCGSDLPDPVLDALLDVLVEEVLECVEGLL